MARRRVIRRRSLRRRATRTRRTMRRMSRKRTTLRPSAPLRVRRVETKTAINGAVLQPFPVNNLSFLTNVVPLTPYESFLTINKGTAQCDRIGNQVSVKRHVVRFVFTLNERDPNNTDPLKVARPYYIRLWFFKLKPRLPQTVAEAAQIAQTNMFQWGNNADLGLFGTVNDLIQPINKDAVELCTTRTYKMGRSDMNNAGYPAGGSLVEIQSNASWANNDFMLTARGKVDVTKYVPKDLRWEDGNNVTAMNRPLFMMCTLHPADGSAYTNTEWTGDPRPVSFWYRNDLDYIDP